MVVYYSVLTQFWLSAEKVTGMLFNLVNGGLYRVHLRPSFLGRWKDVNKKELWDMLNFSGFRKLIIKYGSYGFNEMFKSFFTALQVKELRRYIPDITAKDVEYK